MEILWGLPSCCRTQSRWISCFPTTKTRLTPQEGLGALVIPPRLHLAQALLHRSPQLHLRRASASASVRRPSFPYASTPVIQCAATIPVAEVPAAAVAGLSGGDDHRGIGADPNRSSLSDSARETTRRARQVSSAKIWLTAGQAGMSLLAARRSPRELNSSALTRPLSEATLVAPPLRLIARELHHLHRYHKALKRQARTAMTSSPARRPPLIARRGAYPRRQSSCSKSRQQSPRLHQPGPHPIPKARPTGLPISSSSNSYPSRTQ